MRRTFAESLLAIDSGYYSDVRHLQYEKSGGGVPPRRPVDLYFVLNDVSHFVEFKYWHTQVKVRSGILELGKGNATSIDYGELKRDFCKQAEVADDTAAKLVLYLPQVDQYRGSASELVIPHAKRRDPENARALFESHQGRSEVLNHDNRDIPFELARPPVELVSLEGVAFRLFTYRIRPRSVE